MEKARLDWLVELGGASALAGASGYAALKLQPALGVPAAVAAFAVGYAMMRTVKALPRAHALPDFPVEPIEPDELLLDVVLGEEDILLLDDVFQHSDALLLEEVLSEIHPDSRVIQLFAGPAIPTPGELKQRIDRHLAGAHRSAPTAQPDASQALYAALEDLRRSLR